MLNTPPAISGGMKMHITDGDHLAPTNRCDQTCGCDPDCQPS